MTGARFSGKISDIYPPRWPTQTNLKKRPFALNCRLCRSRLQQNRPIQMQNRVRLCESSCRFVSYPILRLSALQQGRLLFQNLPTRICSPPNFSSHRRPRQFLLPNHRLFRCQSRLQPPRQSLRHQVCLLRDPKKRQRALPACRTRPPGRSQRFR